MNVIEITKLFPFRLLKQQQDACKGDKCLGYLSSHNVQVTTCGTRIESDNVFPQKDITQTKIIERAGSPVVEVHGVIGNQPVIATANKELMKKQNLFDFCLRQSTVFDPLDVSKRWPITEYSMCKHVKFVVDNKDIVIAN